MEQRVDPIVVAFNAQAGDRGAGEFGIAAGRATVRGIAADERAERQSPAMIAAAHHDTMMRSRGRGSRRAVILGSVSRQVAGRTPCPVLMLPRGADETANELLSHAAAQGAP
jgi:nucleotide-binding universal stress UspA family protein